MLKKNPTLEEIGPVHYRELTTSEVFIETALNSLTDSLYVIRTTDFKVLWANRAFCNSVGLDSGSIIGRHCYELTHHSAEPCSYANHPCPLIETLKTGKPSTMEHIHFDSADKKRFIEVQTFPMEGNRGGISRIVHIDRDITERRRLEEQLKNYNETLEKLVRERTAELEKKNKILEEMNTALHVLFQKREDDKRQVEDLMASNIKSLVYPYLEKMKKDSPDANQQRLLGIMETHLNELLSPLLKKLQQFNLTPKEVQVAAMVKDGKTTKEIAEILRVETSSINDHRNNIRKKLRLSRDLSLQSKLQSLT